MEYYIRTEADVKIFVHDINPGGKTTILFIHGWPLSHRAYEYQFNKLPAMGFRCIGMDTRGFGKSGKPHTGYSYNRIADDIRGVVHALDLKNFVLAGHSMGGAAAIRYISRYNGYGVSKLALFGAAAPSLTMRPGFPYGHPKEDITQIIESSLKDRLQMLRDTAPMFFSKPITQPQSDWFFLMGFEASGIATAACAMTFRDEALFNDLDKIRVPTLILHGIHDQVCLFPLAEVMHQSIRNSVLIPFENSGHGLFYEEQDKFNSELARFIGQV
ncbi:alpha/beta fold hydrolase [Ruminiclostridium cellobioparum]|uniref:Putative hydrolases or acyltransferases (Alpha/beta hydrolase superfamily) n=1 Tax=Ruminiclostridium cellobioparum subsp. termitidis CT1112 TaxID=1195236 RepID=S0FIC8_RUMCE|nr:alpha/beta hydrolase [Ruminiclostridium cellobioparum]EMS71720.1 putative hydrolases or acyltransferases (alpha/beta hydrolase superfamily) [Ruminiclostridium cellobioparum subsp. termitidis CT1112]